MHRVLAAWILLGGCNQVFGIDETQVFVDPCPMDGDCDGVIDAVDNCPVEPNAGQGDADADGVGDACDACAMAFDVMLDVDGDGVVAAQDRCPGAADADQADADGDGVGDACDPDPTTAQALRCFTDFRLQPDVNQAWPLNASWRWFPPLIHSPPDTAPFVLVHRGTRLPATGAAQVVLEPAVSEADFEAGVALATSDGALVARCELFRTGGGALSVQLAGAAGALTTAPFEFLAHPQAVTLAYRPVGDRTELTCSARSTGGAPVIVTATVDAALAPTAVALTAKTTSTVFEALSIYAPAP